MSLTGCSERLIARSISWPVRTYGTIEAPGPKGHCIRTVSSHWPNSKPTAAKVPIIWKPAARCKAMDATCSESPMTANLAKSSGAGFGQQLIDGSAPDALSVPVGAHKWSLQVLASMSSIDS